MCIQFASLMLIVYGYSGRADMKLVAIRKHTHDTETLCHVGQYVLR